MKLRIYIYVQSNHIKQVKKLLMLILSFFYLRAYKEYELFLQL